VIKNIARYYGAVDVGITRVEPYHVYSFAGRREENWGTQIDLEHKSAIVVVVAMDFKMMKQAPSLPAILESSRRYVEVAKIANIIAEYLRQIGYKARAHTDGNYETLCVPLAVDSGLGELGRMGILVHPQFGPCVRLSVVTTELELIPSEIKKFHIKEFCRICKKCAENCPTNSIVMEEEPETRGFVHWTIEQEKCFGFWKNAGTDCGFCIRVCPYTKPDTLLHKLVRFYISRNTLNQRIALFLDDLLYGRKSIIPDKNPVKLFFDGQDSE
jgi:reductive dehalogenase